MLVVVCDLDELTPELQADLFENNGSVTIVSLPASPSFPMARTLSTFLIGKLRG